MTKRERRPPAKTRAIGYEIEGDLQGTSAGLILEKALEAQLITEFHVGRSMTWFNGPPGTPLRELRDRLLALAGPQPPRIRYSV